MSRVFSKYFFNRFSDIRIQMHRIYKINLWIFLRKFFNGKAHINKTLTKIFSAMPCNQNHLLAILQMGNIISGFI